MWAPERMRVIGRRPDDCGFAMIVSVMVSAIASILVLTMVATGTHVQHTTVRSRQWNLALQVAEAGVERAVARLAVDDTYRGTGIDTAESVAGGEFFTSVTAPALGWRVVRSSGWVPSRTAGNRINRVLEVTYGPPSSFRLAVLSTTTLNLNNTGTVRGNVFANESVEILNALHVQGSVTSATGTVYLKNNAEVERVADDPTSGNVYSGGFHPAERWGIRSENGAVIHRNAHSQIEPPCGSNYVNGQAVYNIENRGAVRGKTLAGGVVRYAGGLGGSSDNVCDERHPRLDLPTFNPSAYDGIAKEWTSVASYMAAPGGSLTGVHRVTPSAAELAAYAAGDVGAITIDHEAKTIAGNFTLITTGRFRYGNAGGSQAFYSGPREAMVNIIVLNATQSPAAIEIENQLKMPSPGPAVLFFANGGLIDVKNGAETDGAVYSGRINMKNDIKFTYDPRAERIYGFGAVRYERVSYIEQRPQRG